MVANRGGGEAAMRRATAEIFVWALPQALRDGFVHFDMGEEAVEAFEDVAFPIALGREAAVEPAFSTAIVTVAAAPSSEFGVGGRQAHLRRRAGRPQRGGCARPVAFFRARRGPAVGFRLQDPFDHSSNGMVGGRGAADQCSAWAMASNGIPADQGLWGSDTPHHRPVAGTVRVSVEGEEMAAGWTLADKGMVAFDAAPAPGDEVRAGFRFDVPVRFAEDQLSLSRATFAAGDIPSVPLIEIRE